MFQLCYLVFLGAFFAEFSICLRICLEESVPTVSSVAMSVIFSSFDMMEIKIMVKIRTKYFPLIFFCCFHVEPYPRHVQNELLKHARFSILPALRSRAVRLNI